MLRKKLEVEEDEKADKHKERSVWMSLKEVADVFL